MKTYQVHFSTQACQHIDDFEDWLRDVGVKTDYIDRLIDHCLSLEIFPYARPSQDGTPEGIRITAFRKRHLIHYFVQGNNVEILGIYSVKQDI